MARRSYEERARRAAEAEASEPGAPDPVEPDPTPVTRQREPAPPQPTPPEPQPAGEVWVVVKARAQLGFWRAGLFWPRTETVRRVSAQVAERLSAEPNLIVRVSNDRPPSSRSEGD